MIGSDRAIEDIDDAAATVQKIREEVGKVVVGQEEMIGQVLNAILCNGNVLLEGVPGIGKTLTVRTLSQVMDLEFSRIQGTPDLMPSDITGTYIVRETDGAKELQFQQGPVFANVVLADEINRATPKTQAALLEAMQEQQVTIGNQTFKLSDPFFVLATQNPIDLEGTFVLPEAQTDRFLLKVVVDYPNRDEELDIIDRFTNEVEPDFDLEQIVDREDIHTLQEITRDVPISDDVKQAAVHLVEQTRHHELIDFGASPRASLALVLTGKARALMQGRSYVSLDDVKAMAPPVLRHRIILDFEAEKENLSPDDVIHRLVNEL